MLAIKPDGVFLSNGPGDPEPLDYAIETIRGLLGKKPIFGICLGHQLLGAGLRRQDLQAQVRPSRRESAGAEPGRPARSRSPRRTTASPSTRTRCPPCLEVTHLNLNDDTIEGLRHREAARLQRAVPPRSLRRPARQPLSVPGIPAGYWTTGFVSDLSSAIFFDLGGVGNHEYPHIRLGPLAIAFDPLVDGQARPRCNASLTTL